MIRNYIKIAFRNLKKTKLFSIVNILGLAIGITACLMILHYVNFEKSYDRFHENSDRIYRIRYERTDSEGQSVRFASCCPPASPIIGERFPEVENIGRVLDYQAIVSRGDVKFLEEKMYFAEPGFLEIFDFNVIKGDRSQGLAEPNHIYISESFADKYFGGEDPVGQSLNMNGNGGFERRQQGGWLGGDSSRPGQATQRRVQRRRRALRCCRDKGRKKSPDGEW